MEYVKKGKEIIDTSDEAIDFVDKLISYIDKMKKFKPEVKSLRVDYLEKNTEIKLLLNIPQGFPRNYKYIEIPAYDNYIIYELFDGSTLDKIKTDWILKGNNWVASAKELTASEQYFVIMKGNITQNSLDHLVRLYCPNDPQKTDLVDKYWIDSAIKDMAILEKIYEELTVDRVDTCVDVGLERQFTASIPLEIKEYMQARGQRDVYYGTKDRQQEFRSSYRYRMARSRLGKITPKDLYDISSDTMKPENFIVFVAIEDPFRISGIQQLDTEHLYPERIGVRVQTDLNYKRPVAQGDLTFKKVDFGTKLKEKFEKLIK